MCICNLENQKRNCKDHKRTKKQYFKDKSIKKDQYFLSYTGDPLSHMGIYNVIKEAGERVKIEGASVVRIRFDTFSQYSAYRRKKGKNRMELERLTMTT